MTWAMPARVPIALTPMATALPAKLTPVPSWLTLVMKMAMVSMMLAIAVRASQIPAIPMEIALTMYATIAQRSQIQQADTEEDPNGVVIGDTVGNLCDNCPTMVNPSQANLDGDQFGNICDPCPTDAISDDCEMEDTVDMDGDGAPDLIDECPLTVQSKPLTRVRFVVTPTIPVAASFKTKTVMALPMTMMNVRPIANFRSFQPAAAVKTNSIAAGLAAMKVVVF